MKYFTSKVEKKSEKDEEIITEKKPVENVEELLKPDYYNWFYIIKDFKFSEWHFIPTDSISKYVEKNRREKARDQELAKLEYICYITLSFIRRLKQLNVCSEKLLEFSSLSTYGIWKQEYTPYFIHKFDLPFPLTYLESYPIERLKKVFKDNEENFISSTMLETDDILLTQG